MARGDTAPLLPNPRRICGTLQWCGFTCLSFGIEIKIHTWMRRSYSQIWLVNGKAVWQRNNLIVYVLHRLIVAIWRWRSWSAVVQVMACFLTPPSLYLNHCWLTMKDILLPSSHCNVCLNTQDINLPQLCFELTDLKSQTNLRGNNQII